MRGQARAHAVQEEVVGLSIVLLRCAAARKRRLARHRWPGLENGACGMGRNCEEKKGADTSIIKFGGTKARVGRGKEGESAAHLASSPFPLLKCGGKWENRGQLARAP